MGRNSSRSCRTTNRRRRSSMTLLNPGGISPQIRPRLNIRSAIGGDDVSPPLASEAVCIVAAASDGNDLGLVTAPAGRFFILLIEQKFLSSLHDILGLDQTHAIFSS